MNATKFAKVLAVAALLAGCKDIARDTPPPLDRFRFPVGVSLRHQVPGCTSGTCACTPASAADAGCDTLLYVVSSNFDLAYDSKEGGTLISLRVPRPAERPASLAAQENWAIPDLSAWLRGATRIGSFGGDVAILDESTCPGWETTLGGPPAALVASRNLDRLYRLSLGRDGSSSCGGDCRLDLDPTLRDPFDVSVVCRGQGAYLTASAFVTYLTTPVNIGFLSEVRLQPAGFAWQNAVNVGGDAPRYASFVRAQDRLFFTGRFAGPGTMPFRWLELAQPYGTNPINPPSPIDLATQVYGAETTGFAVSTDGTRAYIGLRLYDGATAGATGVRTLDIGGALAIVDLTAGPGGMPTGRMLGLVPVGLSPAEVRVVPRAGRADLVVVSCSGDGTVWLYDDQAGYVPRIFSLDQSNGAPVLGQQPTGLAVETRADGTARIFVSSFGSHFVSVVRLDDPADARGAWIEMRLGFPR